MQVIKLKKRVLDKEQLDRLISMAKRASRRADAERPNLFTCRVNVCICDPVF